MWPRPQSVLPVHTSKIIFVAFVQSLSHIRLPATPWTHQVFPSFTISQSLFRLMPFESVMLSISLILWCPSPLALNFSQHQDLSQLVSFAHQVAKVLKLQLQHQSVQWYSGFISYRMDWFDLLSSRDSRVSPMPQFKSISSVLSLLMVQFSHPYMTIGKAGALTIWTSISKVLSLLFNMLCMFA